MPFEKYLIGNAFIFYHGSDPQTTTGAVKACLDVKITQLSQESSGCKW